MILKRKYIYKIFFLPSRITSMFIYETTREPKILAYSFSKEQSNYAESKTNVSLTSTNSIDPIIPCS
jgi:hypothetical protein